MTRLGRSKISRRIEKQKVAGTGAPLGFSRTQCACTLCVVFSNACDAKFSQYSTTDWFSNSYTKPSFVNYNSSPRCVKRLPRRYISAAQRARPSASP